MTDKLVELVRFDDPFKAEIVRLALGENGVEAFIESAETNRTMHYVGTALGGVKVLVRAPQKVRAEQILATIDFSTKPEKAPLWICTKCGEQVESSFDECWSCGASRPENAAMVAPEIDEESYASHASDDEPESTDAEVGATNPYSSPKTRSDAVSPASPNVSEAEDVALRAWRASVIGLVICPGLAHFYSAYLLLDIRDVAPQLSAKGKRRRFWAILINTTMILLAIAFVAVNAFDLWRVVSFRP